MAAIVDEPVPKQGVSEKQTEFAPSPTQKAARRRESLTALGFLTPQLVGLVVFMLGPLIFALILAFSNWDGFGNRSLRRVRQLPVGVHRPADVDFDAQHLVVHHLAGARSDGFGASLRHICCRRWAGVKSIYRIFFFAPVVTSSIAVSAIWLWLLNPELSPLNELPRQVRHHDTRLAAEPVHRDTGDRPGQHLAGARLHDGDVHGRPRERAEITDGGG